MSQARQTRYFERSATSPSSRASRNMLRFNCLAWLIECLCRLQGFSLSVTQANLCQFGESFGGELKNFKISPKLALQVPPARTPSLGVTAVLGE